MRTQAEYYVRPVPKKVGQVQLTLLRDNSFGGLATAFYLRLSSNSQALLRAEKVQQSMTKHYRLKIDLLHQKYVRHDDELYIGRLRANFAQNEFYIYDNGMNPRDLKPGHSLLPGQLVRRQFGAVHYSSMTRSGGRVPRNVEVFVPDVPAGGGDQVWCWPDTDRKKHHIYKEYQE